jgi:type IV pilus assembly protein PilA
LPNQPVLSTTDLDMKSKFTLSGQRGFSLVELLVVIAVIAVIAAIAIPNIANITEQAKDAKSRRNAQNIASVAAAAKAAGTTTPLQTVAQAEAALKAGTPVEAVVGGQTLTFGISALTDEEWDAAEGFLDDGPAGGSVVYTGAGGS